MSLEKEDNKFTLKFSSFELDTYTPTLPEEINIRGRDFIYWGKNNLYPYFLYDIYYNCATLQSIINGSIDYTIGNGISFEGIPDHILFENELGDTLQDTLSKCITDRWIFGGFAIKIRYSATNQIASLEWVDFRKVRVDESEDYIYIYDFKKNYGQNNAYKYPSFKNDERSPAKVLYYKGSKTRSYYPIPEYSAAIVSAETQIEIQEFHYNNIINNFSANKVINFNNAEGMDDDVKDEVERRINEKFSGTKNAGRLMISFNGHKDNAMTVEGIPDDSFDTKYYTLSEETRENLFISLRAQPQLFGLNLSTGFNEQEFNEAFALYNKTAIVPKQNEVIRVVKKIFPDSNIIFSPFKL